MLTLFFFALPFLAALVVAIVMLYKPGQAIVARRWMVIFMLDCAVSILLLAHYYMPALRLSLALDWLFDAAVLCIAPTLYLCVSSLTRLEGLQRRDGRVLWPTAALMSIVAILCLVMSPEERLQALSETTLRLTPPSAYQSLPFEAYRFFSYEFLRSFFLIQIVAVVIWSLQAIRNYERMLDDFFTTADLIAGRVRRLLRIGLILMGVFCMLLAAADYSRTLVSWVMPVFCIGISVSFAFIAFYAHGIRYSAEQLAKMEKKMSHPVATPTSSPSLVAQLRRIEEEHLYRDPDLTIFTLSRTLGTNRTYLTRALRECYGESFSEYINRLRIEEAARLMQSTPSLTLQEIASEVGYNSPTSLYRNFVRIYHCAPTAYKCPKD